MTSGRALAKAAFGAVDSMRDEALARFMTPYGSFTLGDAEPSAGRAAIATTVDQFCGSIGGLSRLIADVRKKDSSAVVRLSITHTRKGGGTVVLPCPNMRQRGTSDQIADDRTYVDVNSVSA